MQLVIALFSVALVAAAAWVVAYSRRSGSKLPPGPPRLPIFGNILQLGKNPHLSLTKLAKTYGPLMSIKLGTKWAVVVSSPDASREMLQKQGNVFSDRFIPDGMRVLGFEKTIGLAPANSTKWKNLRRISREKLFSSQALQASQHLRRQGLQKMIDHVSRHSDDRSSVDVGEAIFTIVCSLVFATLFSVDLKEYATDHSVSLQIIKEHVNGFAMYIGLPNISDFFPVLAPLDLQGIRRKTSYHLGGLLKIVEHLIGQRLQERNAESSTKYEKKKKKKKKNDFLETLLDIMEGKEYDLSIEEIKHSCLGHITAATDSTSATTEWAMVELLLHPDKLAKLKAELKSVVGEKRVVEESDISRLPYLEAVIKEVLRYHPIVPLLIPRKSQEEAQVYGYTIPKDTRIIFNFWAIAMDPNIYKNPEQFEPERYIGSDINYTGQHFELIPFGSGRRICPGLPLAGRMLPCIVGTLCHNFDWKFQEEAQSKQFHREDVFGMALQKKNPLMALPTKV